MSAMLETAMPLNIGPALVGLRRLSPTYQSVLWRVTPAANPPYGVMYLHVGFDECCFAGDTSKQLIKAYTAWRLSDPIACGLTAPAMIQIRQKSSVCRRKAWGWF